MALDTEAAIMANFEFLSREGDVDMDEDDDDEEMNDVIAKGSGTFRTGRRFKVIWTEIHKICWFCCQYQMAS